MMNRSVYQKIVSVGFWIVLIVFTVGVLTVFAVGGEMLGRVLSGHGGDYTRIGVILGSIIGFFVTILTCGLVATVLNKRSTEAVSPLS